MGVTEFLAIFLSLAFGFAFIMGSFLFSYSFIKAQPLNALKGYVRKNNISESELLDGEHPFTKGKASFNKMLPKRLLMWAIVINCLLVILAIFFHIFVFVIPFSMFILFYPPCFFFLKQRNVYKLEGLIPEYRNELILDFHSNA